MFCQRKTAHISAVNYCYAVANREDRATARRRSPPKRGISARFYMARSAVAGCRERLASGVMTCAAGSLGCLSRLVRTRLIIQRSRAGLRPQLVVAEFAVVAGALTCSAWLKVPCPNF